MPKTPLLRLGTRRSPLALAQAHEARARLCAVHGWDESAVELVPVLASGDRVQDRPLADLGGKALWTRELDAWLVEGRIDAAVHSMKDVETLRPGSIAIAAILPREDKADCLLGAASLADIPEGAIVGTSAPRRGAQLLHVRPDVKVVPIRGNVATRIAKLEAGEAQATFLAAAGLARLGESAPAVRLDPADWLPAPAQAAIGIECRADDAQTAALIAAIDHAPSRSEVMAERALLAGLGGGCSSAVGVLTVLEGEAMTMRAAIWSLDGAVRRDGDASFPPGDAEGPRALAAQLLAEAPHAIAVHFSGPC